MDSKALYASVSSLSAIFYFVVFLMALRIEETPVKEFLVGLFDKIPPMVRIVVLLFVFAFFLAMPLISIAIPKSAFENTKSSEKEI